jgi:CO/xanthine dehydrogenase FAD-binding subunit
VTRLLRPESWGEALALRSEDPEAVPILGGTDLLVALNFGRRDPAAILDLSGLSELSRIDAGEDGVRVGAGVSYNEIIAHGDPRLRVLAAASRTVGSPQIRNRGTLGGNLGTASPAGDGHPPLLALGAEVEVASVRGHRRVPVDEYFRGPGRSVLEDDELICAVHVSPVDGGQEFAKVGPRNAMIIAACSFAVVVDPVRRRVGTGIGSAGPTPLRAPEAEAFAASALDDGGSWHEPRLDQATLKRFGELVAEAAQPIDDVRATADYRRHALRILGARTLGWACGATVNGKGA